MLALTFDLVFVGFAFVSSVPPNREQSKLVVALCLVPSGNRYWRESCSLKMTRAGVKRRFPGDWEAQ